MSAYLQVLSGVLCALQPVSAPQATPLTNGANFDVESFDHRGRPLLAVKSMVATGVSTSVWDLDAGKPIATWTEPGEPRNTFSMVFCAGPGFLVSAQNSGTLKLYDPDTWQAVGSIQVGRTSRSEVKHLASPDSGNLLAATVHDGGTGFIMLIDVSTREVLSTLRTGGMPNWVSFSPDGRLLCAGVSLRRTKTTSIDVWDVSTQRRKRLLNGLGDTLARFSPDSKTIAISSGSTVTLLDLSSERTRPLGRHGDVVSSMSFSNDGSILATAALGSPTVRLWSIRMGIPTAGSSRSSSRSRSKVVDKRWIDLAHPAALSILDVAFADRVRLVSASRPKMSQNEPAKEERIGEGVESRSGADTLFLWTFSRDMPAESPDR